MTGCILAVGRIVGESAALLFTAGAAEVIAGSIARAYTSNGATLSVLLYLRAFEDGDFASAWGIGAVLLVLVLLIDLAARLAKTKLKQKQVRVFMDNNMPVNLGKNLNLWYGDFKASRASRWTWANRRSLPHRPLGLRQIHLPQDPEPDERPCAERPHRGRRPAPGEDIFSKEMQLTDLRRRVGMVFQKANPFPMSIYDNITYGPKLHGVRNKAELDELVESSLRGAALWDEVKDRLKRARWASPAASSSACASPGSGCQARTSC